MGWVGPALQVGSAIAGAVGGRSAARNSSRASQQAIDLQNQRYGESKANFAPYMSYGSGAGGLGGLTALANGDYSGFQRSPDYMAAREGMTYGLDHSAAADGRLFSGGYAADLSKAQGDLASGYLGNYRNSLQWGAELGANSASSLANLGSNNANAVGQLYGAKADARNSGIGAITGGLTGIAGIGANYFGGRPPGSSYGSGNNFGVPMPGSGAAPGFGTTYGRRW